MEYFTVLTETGAAKIAAATANNTTIDLTEIALGDGAGEVVMPDASQEELVNEVFRADLNDLSVDENNNTWVVATGYIPATTGNFWVREVGIFDVDGDLIAVGNYPETFKPILADGVAKDLYVKVIMEVSNSDAITLQIDPSVVMASREFVENIAQTKQDKLISGQTIKTINAQSLLGSGDIVLELIANGIPQSAMLQGDISITDLVKTLTFDVFTYTGKTTTINSTYYTGASGKFDYTTDTLRFGDYFWNDSGNTQTINIYDAFNLIVDTVDVPNQSGCLNIGIKSCDFTVNNNGNGYRLDRTTFEVKDDLGNVVTDLDIELEVPIVNVYIKQRNSSNTNYFFDGLRGVYKRIHSENANAEADSSEGLKQFTTNSLILGLDNGINTSSSTYLVNVEIYTHVRTGLTNHGIRYVEIYNPHSENSIELCKGSSQEGHLVPNSLNGEADITIVKNLSYAAAGIVVLKQFASNEFLELFSSNSTSAKSTSAHLYLQSYEGGTELACTGTDTPSNPNVNNSSYVYIIYAKKSSATRMITTYNGNGTSIDIPIKDINNIGKLPRKVVLKSIIGAASNYFVHDTKRGISKCTEYSSTSAETTQTYIAVENGKLTITGSSNPNVLGYTYLLEVEFDTDASNNGSYVNIPSDTSNLYMSNNKTIFSNGYNTNILKNIVDGNIVPSNGWIDDAVNYVKVDSEGVYYAATTEPSFGKVSTVGDYFIDGKWYDKDGNNLGHITYLPIKVPIGANGNILDLYGFYYPVLLLNYVKFLSNVDLSNLPTVDPLIEGLAWNNSGVITISEGA
jgi:hypothetical protein